MNGTGTQTPLDGLVQPLGGLVGRLVPAAHMPGEPNFSITIARLGGSGSEPTGAGASPDPTVSRLRAVAEALERYASCLRDDRQLLRASARELGDEALDLDTVARLSREELAHPRAPIRAPDPAAPIGWVRGVRLNDGQLAWVPAAMVYQLSDPYAGAERFWVPISTGCAAHTSYEAALVGALCEAAERDATAVTWLQKLALPRIDLDMETPELDEHLRRNRMGGDHLRTVFFDATTDLRIPTVFGVQVSPHNTRLATMVACSTDPDPAVAVTKTIRELASTRLALIHGGEPPESLNDFNDVAHGAVYMGHVERAHAFKFLLDSPRRVQLSQLPRVPGETARATLASLLERFSAAGMTAYAVDLTTDEAIRVGMCVVRVIVPELQPLSFVYRARYLGHPRLYEAPRRMGYPVHAEADLNPWPQPFA